MTITILNNQNIFDIALQYCGNVDYSVDIAAINSMAITDDLIAGNTLQIPTIAILAEESNVVGYFENSNTKPSSNTL